MFAFCEVIFMSAIKMRSVASLDWSLVDFGDARLNERAIRIGEAFLRSPFASPPKMLRNKKDIKGFYRFMDSEKVAHEKLVRPHIIAAHQRLAGHPVVLCVQDSTTIPFDRNYEIEGLYDVGNIPGVVVHNTIGIIPYEHYGVIDGLLGQTILKRKPSAERGIDDNETRLWMDSIHSTGHPPHGTCLVDVMDRGADALEVMHCSKKNKHDYVVRARHDRLLGEHGHLFEFARTLPSAGKYRVSIQGRCGRDRVAIVDVAFSLLTLPPPKNRQDLAPLLTNIVHVREPNPVAGYERVEWLLFTSLDVESFEDALLVVKYYTYRWIIEEYHKCMKTGFRLDKTQFKTLPRIEALLGFIAVSSVRLLQLRDIVRNKPNVDAVEYVDKVDIQIVNAYYSVKEANMTIDRFLRYIAQMGGFMNRKSDGNPGWQSLWEGWKFFLGLKEGVMLQREGRICGEG